MDPISTTIAVFGTLLAIIGIVNINVVRSGHKLTADQLEYIREKQVIIKSVDNSKLPLPPGADICSHNWRLVANEKISTKAEEKVLIVQCCDLCGLVDKSEAVVKALPPPEPVSECKHDWSLKRDAEVESAYEQAAKLYQMIFEETGEVPPPEVKLPDLGNPVNFRKTLVRERICNRCGKIHVTQASNIDTEVTV